MKSHVQNAIFNPDVFEKKKHWERTSLVVKKAPLGDTPDQVIIYHITYNQRLEQSGDQTKEMIGAVETRRAVLGQSSHHWVSRHEAPRFLESWIPRRIRGTGQQQMALLENCLFFM